jgi:hypothetical protein
MRILRFLFGFLVLGALAWTGWWLLLARGQELALAAWFDDRARAGWQAEYREIELTGFPLELRRTVTAIHLADPETGWAWTAPWLKIDSAPFAPSRFAVAWPGEQMLAVPGERSDITVDAMSALIWLRPESALGLVRLSAEAEGLDIRGYRGTGPGWTAGAARFRATVAERVNDEGYSIELHADRVLMPEPLMARIDPLGLAGREIERASFDGSAVFAEPLDRHVIEQGRLALRLASIRSAGFQWGETRLEAQGKIRVDKRGYPKGKLDVTARQWRELIAMARRSGALGGEMAEALTQALELVALLGGDRNELDATLTFDDGEIWIGPISIGRAPRLAPPTE